MTSPARRTVLAVMSFVVAATLAGGPSARADVAGSQDHPLVGRYQGAEIVGYQVTDYDEATIIDGPFDPAATERSGPGFKRLEGRQVLIYYKLPAGRSMLEVLRNYQASLNAKGLAEQFTCATTDGSCFATRQPDAGYFLGNALGDPLTLPKLDDDYVHNWFEQGGRYLLAARAQPSGSVHVSLALGQRQGGAVAVVRVIESKEMDSGRITFLNASQMEQAIADTGRVSLYGIQFDFDRAELRPESTPTLDEIARLLQDNPGLRLDIIGHTDNKGSDAYNLDLSARRAASVVAALTGSYAIAPDRLAPSGAGAGSPVASNDSDDGRAKNRRVELIRR